MKYRAKITRIFSKIESCYNLKKYNLARDAKDGYIEVDTEEEAVIIEHLNKLQEELDKTYLKLLEMRGR